MPDVDARERELTARLHAEASAVTPPDDLAARILASVRAEREAPGLEERVGSHLRRDAQGVRAPGDMPSRVRSAIGGSRRGRLLPRLMLVPALGVAVAALLFGVSAPWDDGSGDGDEMVAGSGSLAAAPTAAGARTYFLAFGGAEGLATGWVPDGYVLSTGDEYSGNRSTGLSYRLVNGSGGYVDVRQEPGSQSAHEPSSRRGRVFDEPDAYAGLSVDHLHGERRVVSRYGDYVVTVTANQLSEDELLRFVESLTPLVEDLDGDGAP